MSDFQGTPGRIFERLHLLDGVGRNDLVSGQNLSMALTSGTALLLVVCFAAFVGSTIPILMKRMNIDPALATGPFITTSNDIIGIAIYLAITFNFDMLSLINEGQFELKEGL